MDQESVVKTVVAAAGTVATYLLGGFDGILTALLTLAFMDYASGMAAAWWRRRLSSEVGVRGIAKKAGMFAVVAVCHVIDQTGGVGEPILRSVAVWWYIGNEAISIVENLTDMGVPIPKRVRTALALWREEASKRRDRPGSG